MGRPDGPANFRRKLVGDPRWLSQRSVKCTRLGVVEAGGGCCRAGPAASPVTAGDVSPTDSKAENEFDPPMALVVAHAVRQEHSAGKRELDSSIDDEANLLTVKRNGCSEVFKRSKDKDFDLVIVVPTARAKTETAVVADAASRQYRPQLARDWPGKPAAYPWRIDVRDGEMSHLEAPGSDHRGRTTWAAAWTVAAVEIDEDDLY